jgi:hypothetical protein
MDKKFLIEKYSAGASMKEISIELGCSVDRVKYWMDKFQIERRNISDAIYAKHNPNGDPFHVKVPATKGEAVLWGKGIGLFWGEGNKADRYAVRLGNSDPELIKEFIRFLTELCGVDRRRLKFSLQLFSDMDPKEALDFWINKLDVAESQFYKITVTISGSLGTYRKKTQRGVLQVYFHNKKLRDYLIGQLPT